MLSILNANITEGRCPKAKTSAEKIETPQNTLPCHFPFNIKVDMTHIPKGMKNNRKITSSPIPATAEVTIEVGKGGCGSAPNLCNRCRNTSARIKKIPLPKPT